MGEREEAWEDAHKDMDQDVSGFEGQNLRKKILIFKWRWTFLKAMEFRKQESSLNGGVRKETVRY